MTRSSLSDHAFLASWCSDPWRRSSARAGNGRLEEDEENGDDGKAATQAEGGNKRDECDVRTSAVVRNDEVQLMTTHARRMMASAEA